MRWRTALAITIATSWLLYSLLPITSDLFRFAVAGLAFGLLSRALPVLINWIVSAQALVEFRLRPSPSLGASIEEGHAKGVDREEATTSNAVQRTTSPEYQRHKEVINERTRE